MAMAKPFILPTRTRKRGNPNWGKPMEPAPNVVAELAALGVAFVSLRDNLDLSTPSGRLMFQIISAMAEFERALDSGAGSCRTTERTRQRETTGETARDCGCLQDCLIAQSLVEDQTPAPLGQGAHGGKSGSSHHPCAGPGHSQQRFRLVCPLRICHTVTGEML